MFKKFLSFLPPSADGCRLIARKLSFLNLSVLNDWSYAWTAKEIQKGYRRLSPNCIEFPPLTLERFIKLYKRLKMVPEDFLCAFLVPVEFGFSKEEMLTLLKRNGLTLVKNSH